MSASAAAPSTNPLVLFCAGLTARMSFKQQVAAGRVVDTALYTSAVVAYLIGWYYGRFAYVAYAIMAVAAALLVVCGPNWKSAYRSARAGQMVTGASGEDLHFLRNTVVRDYYRDLRDDEQAVDSSRRAPFRF
jgi:hypothetical protein